MNILVTGGFGFIGSCLLEKLLADPANSVHVVDDLSTSPLPLDHLLREIGECPNLTFTICTVREFCRGDAHRRSFDEIYHLASVVGPAGVLPHTGVIIKKTVEDTYDLIELALHTGAKLLDVSTSEVYGGGQEGFCSENMPKIIPARYSARLEYAVAKLACEVALVNTAKVKPLFVVIIRPFNVSGPRQSGVGGFVLPRFVGLAMRNRPLTIFGGGEQIRAFTHVSDIADGLMLAMRRGKSGEIYNLGNPNNQCTIGELADAVVRLTGSQSSKVYVDPKTIYGPLYEEANNKFPDARKSIDDLDWRPQFSRDETIRQTFEYFQVLPERLREMLTGITT